MVHKDVLTQRCIFVLHVFFFHKLVWSFWNHGNYWNPQCPLTKNSARHNVQKGMGRDLAYISYEFINLSHIPLFYFLSCLRNPCWFNYSLCDNHYLIFIITMMPLFQVCSAVLGTGIATSRISVSLHLSVFFPISFQTIGHFCLFLFLPLWGTELTFL